MINKLYQLVVVGNQKAIVAFVLSGAAVYLAVVGVSLDMTVGEALTVLVTGAVNAGGVWLKANR